jgi:osmotically-inducible protein OsmY
MKLTKDTTTKTASAAKGGASTAREAIIDAREQALEATKEARKQALEVTKDARKQARRRLVRARITAAKARAGTRSKASGASAKAVGAAGTVGLAAGYFLDPESGRRRRHEARDRALALIRRGADRTRRQAEYRGGQVEGKIEAAKKRMGTEESPPNDQDLTERVKSQIFRPADAPKGSVNVNVEHGIVYLRGEVKQSDEIRKLVEQAGAVDGVAGVENLLHTP